MATELVIADVARALSLVVGSLIEKGVTTMLQGSPQGKSLGMTEIHGSKDTCPEVHLSRFGGQPSNVREFKLTSIEEGGFVWKLYLRNGGEWLDKFGGNKGAKIYSVDLYVDGLLCPLDSSHKNFNLVKKKFSRNYWMCADK